VSFVVHGVSSAIVRCNHHRNLLRREFSALTLSLLTLPFIRVAAQEESDSAKVRALEIKLTEAYRQRQFDLLASLLDEDFVLTTSGCPPSCVTLFKITKTGTFSILYNFDQTTGQLPYSTMMQHTNGILYGGTQLGGTGNVDPNCGAGDCGVIYSINIGVAPFVSLVSTSAKNGKTIEILGQGFTGTTGVSFNGTAATFKVASDTYLTATVPTGATTGSVTVTMPGRTLKSSKTFRVTPQITSFSPPSGAVGTLVTITGVSLTQTTKVTFGGVVATSFTVISDMQVTATVPTGAKTGKIVITTSGGTATRPLPSP
jgi:IPT/TIG domain-containing protein